MELTEEVVALLRQPSSCYIATTMADGSPQLTQTWVDTDGEHLIINTVQGYLTLRNIERDPRVAVAISDPANPSRYFQVRGRVIKTTTEGGSSISRRSPRNISARPIPGTAVAIRCG